MTSLAGLERGRVPVDEEVPRRDAAAARWRRDLDRRAGGDQRRRIVEAGIGERDRAADRAHVAHGRVGDLRGRVRARRRRRRAAARRRRFPRWRVKAPMRTPPSAARRIPCSSSMPARLTSAGGSMHARVHHRHQRGAAGERPRVGSAASSAMASSTVRGQSMPCSAALMVSGEPGRRGAQPLHEALPPGAAARSRRCRAALPRRGALRRSGAAARPARRLRCRSSARAGWQRTRRPGSAPSSSSCRARSGRAGR